MKQVRRADVLALTATALALACTPSPEPLTTSVTQQPLDEATPLGQGSWSITGRPGINDGGESYTLLSDGTVLIVGGGAELYDPLSGRFTELESPQRFHSDPAAAVLLRNGIVAFFAVTAGPSGWVELYDPAERRFSIAAELDFNSIGAAPVLLPNGNVLVKQSGGDCGPDLGCLRVFDVASSTMGTPISVDSTTFSVTPLPNGKVLLAGRELESGEQLPALLFDPTTGELEETGFMLRPCEVLFGTGAAASSTLLPDGRVLFCCGTYWAVDGPPTPCEYYDPAAKAFVEGPSRGQFRNGAPMIVLPSGQVLVVGGGSGYLEGTFFFELTETTELLEVGASAFTPGPSMRFARDWSSAIVLPSGKVLVAGGGIGGTPMETYDPGVGGMNITQSHSVYTHDRFYGGWPASAALPDGDVLFCGDPASVYDPQADTVKTLNLSCSAYNLLTLLPSGRLLAVDGFDLSHSAVIDPRSDEMQNIPGNSSEYRAGTMFATVLSSGAVLLSGGGSTSAELFEPAQNRFVALPDMKTNGDNGGVSALLGSGKVLILGMDPTTDRVSSEIFDPTRPGSVLLGEAPAALRVPYFAVTLASGDALIGAQAGWARFDAETETFDPLAAFVAVGPGATLLTGDRLFCDRSTCARYDQVTDQFVEFFHDLYPNATRGTPGPGWMITSATGIVLVHTVDDPGRILRIWPFPPDSVRPVLDPVPERLVSGLPVTLTGSRFTRPSAVGAEAMPAFDRHPLVAFMPVSGGGPVFSRVTEWTDTTLRWIAPTTTFRGAGWVHVYVDGVPSIGRFTALDAAPKGVGCSSAVECGSGYCTDGICCDHPCNGDCESCLAENQAPGGIDGACAPVREGLDPKVACTDSFCGETGSCNGQGACIKDGDAPSCSPYICRNSSCLNRCEVADDCAAGYRCTSESSCRRCTPEADGIELGPDSVVSCDAYRCEEGECKKSCHSRADCAAGYSCSDGSCRKCTPEGDGIELGPDSVRSCDAYRCVEGQCRTSCDSRDDCAPNHRCDERECVPGARFDQAVDPGACSATRRRSRSSSLPWLLPLFGWLVRRRFPMGRLRGAMKSQRRAGVGIAMLATLLACSPSPPAKSRSTSVVQQPLGEPSLLVVGQPSVDLYGQASFTLLPDATVLIVSRVGAELYDPGSGLFTTLESPQRPSWVTRGVLLPNGTVAFFFHGELDRGVLQTSTVQFYDPAQRTFTLVAEFTGSAFCGAASEVHAGRCAVLLRDGNVLLQVSGGDCPSTSCLQVFDVLSRAFGTLTPIDFVEADLTILPNGKVFVAGSVAPGQGLQVRLFDPATGVLEEIGPTQRDRDHSASVLLPDGRVLLCGGDEFDTCEYYDPETQRFVDGPSLGQARDDPSMVVLPSGRVLIVGGSSWSPSIDDFVSLATTELLAVGAPESTPGPNLAIGRSNISFASKPSLLVLPSGKVLVGGGAEAPPLEMYDPGIAGSSDGPAPLLSRVSHPVALPDGSLFSCGDPAFVYDPLADAFETLNFNCSDGGTLTLLPNGRVLAVNEWEESHAEIIDPAAGMVERIAGGSRQGHDATVLSSGAVLVNGGYKLEESIDVASFSAELFEPERNRFVALPDMQTVGGGCTALLGSGKVLIVPSTSSASSELFDPTRPGSVLLPETPPALTSPRVAATLTSGDALIGAIGWIRFAAATETFDLLADVSEVGPGAALLTGDRLFCGHTKCARYEQISGRFIEFAHGLALSGRRTVNRTCARNAGSVSDGGAPDWVIASATGLAVGGYGDNQGGSRTFRIWPFPPDAVRPVLDTVPERLASGLPVTLTGSRFTRPPAVGAEAMPPLDRHPLVAFMPVSGGGPVFSRVTEWTDTTLTWIAPTTTFRGAGWVHVYVDGVPSMGRFTFLDAAPTGVSCSSAVECGSGYCTDGVCCDQPCNGSCESCLAANQAPGAADGTCAPVRERLDPKQACKESLCGETGSCDGQGACVVDGQAGSCSPYICRNARCLNRCAVAKDCATGYSCNDGSCGRCTPEDDGIELGADLVRSCVAYRCDEGECKTSCDSRSDCLPGYRCSDTLCVSGAEFDRAVDPGACSATQRGSRSSPLPWLVPLFGWFVRRRSPMGRLRSWVA